MLINPYLGHFILFVIYLNVDSLECNPFPIEPNEFYFSNYTQHFMVESDFNDSDSINVFEHPLTQQLKRVSYDQNAEIIYTIVIDSWSKEFQLEKQFCSLFKLEGYYISCIFIEGLFQEEGEGQTQNDSQFYSFIERFKMPIFTQIDENCQFLFQNSSLELSLFCISLNNLNIYFINQTSSTFTKQDYNIETAQIELCKTKYLQVFGNQCLLIFYDCVQWAIYIYQNNLLKLIFNREIAIQKDPSFNLNVVENFEICQDNVILIGDDQYYHYSYSSDYEFTLNFFSQAPFLKWIILELDCQIKYFLEGSELNNKLYIRNKGLKYELKRIPKYVYFISKMFFIIYEDELEVILTNKFKEKVQLKPFPLHFLNINNIFYHVDQESKVLRFFQYKIFNNSIFKPSKQYLLFYSYDLRFVNESPKYCISFQEKASSNYINNYYSFSINSKCEKIETILLKKENVQIPYNYKIQIVQDPLNLINSISDQQNLESVCHTPKNLLQNSLFLYCHSFGRAYSIFQTSEALKILFCDNQQIIQINILNQKVLNYYDNFILIDYQANYVRLLNIYHNVQQIKELKLDSIIQEVLHYSNFVILFTKLHSLVLIDLNFESQIQLPLILNHLLIKIYLSNINNADKPKKFCMNIIKNSYFIQYYEYFIIFDNGQLYHFKLKQLQIIQIKKVNDMKDNYYIIGVDLTQNALIQYYFDLKELTLLDKYIFTNFKLINPVAYQVVYEYITIRSIMNNSTYLHLFQVEETTLFKLKQIIQIGSNHSFISFKSLFYFDKNNVIQILDLKYLLLKFNPLLSKQDNLIFNQTLIFYIIPESSNYSKIEFSLNLSIFVDCAKLLPLFHQFSIEDNHKILNLSDLYEGPIDFLKIQDNSNVLLEGPFLQSLCQDELSTLTYTTEQINYKINLTTIQSFSNHRQILHLSVLDEFEKFKEIQGIIQKAFNINQNQILLIYFHEQNTKAQIFRINSDNLTLRQDSNKFIIEYLFEQTEIIQIGNLFLARQTILFYVHNNTILSLKKNNKVENLILIQDSNEQYLQLTNLNNPFLTILTITIDKMELKILNEYSLDLDHIQEKFSQHTSKQNSYLYSYQQIYPINAATNNQTLNIICLMVLKDFSILQLIRVDLVSSDVNLTFLNILRNPKVSDSKLHYIDENYIILKQMHDCFVYDIRVSKQIYDYIFTFQCNLSTIWQYNTTHYIFYSAMDKNFTLGQIDYRISVLEDKNQSETCTLIAENKISQAEIIIKLDKVSNKNKFSIEKFTYFGLVFFILTVILLVMYFIRRYLLKQQLIQPSRVFLFSSQ